ncbi:MAG: hypothetical protein GY859_37805, partial [Desulfobacterales bacterium]|nr:hypothetical protein [Desulfobacterales bacterium]
DPAANVLAVGEAVVLLRYDGAVWRAGTGVADGRLFDLWGAAADNVFAVGVGLDYRPVLLNHDGVSWSKMSIPNVGANAALQGVWGASAANVFAVGSNGVILRYDGSAWAAMESGTNVDFKEVWGNSPTDVYAVGIYGCVFQYDGASWRYINLARNHFKGVHGVPGGDIHIVGGRGAILRYNPSNTSCIPLDADLSFTTPCLNLSGTRFGITFRPDGSGLWGADASTFFENPARADCIDFDGSNSFTTPCLDLSGTQYDVKFDYTGEAYLWRPKSNSAERRKEQPIK